MENKKYILLFIAFVLSALAVNAQINVKGVITDAQKIPIPDAYVQIKGTKIGMATDFDGFFELKDVAADAELIFSYTGFETRTIKLEGQTNLEIILLESQAELDEIVVIGYGTSQRRDLTGSIGSVKAEDLNKVPVSNFDQALSGRIAGVQVGATDGTPGQAMNIVIRGGNSITGDNSPLYVIDGVPLDDFDPATLNTADIKSLDVLKDASASAIYGSRGANGVIVITTKEGRKDGTTDIQLSARYGLAYIPTRLEVLGPYEYVKYQQQVALAKDNNSPREYVKYFQESFVHPDLYKGVKGTSWQDEIFRVAQTQQYQAALSGGTRETNFRFSTEYLDEDGTLINTGYKKMINQLKFNHKMNDRTSFYGYLQYTHLKRNGMIVRGDAYNSVIRDAVMFRPVEPIIDDGLGEGGYDPFDDATKYIYNPVKTLNNTHRTAPLDNMRGTMRVTHKFMPNLILQASGNYIVNQSKQTIFFGKETQQAARGPIGINGQDTRRRVETLSSSNTLTYKKHLNDHKFDLMGGLEFQYRKEDMLRASNGEIPTDLFGMKNLGIGTAPGIPQTGLNKNTLFSYFVRGNYDFQSRFMLTATFRADGSSRFQKGNRWGYFPSFSAAWRFSDEVFAQDSDWLSFGKIRAGWGRTGNNRIGDYVAYSQLSTNTSSGYVWGDGEAYYPGAIQSNLGVPDLRWETTDQLDIGLDLGFFDDRIQLTADFYQKQTHDLLLNAETAPHTGFINIQQNVGKTQNTGIELTLNTINIDTGDFKWESQFNISFNKNKTVGLNYNQDAIYTNPDFDFRYNEYAFITQVGQPVGMMYGLEYDRLYQLDDFIFDNETNSYRLKDGIPDNGASSVAPGSIMFKDQNGDGTINSDDRVIIGNPHPDFFGGFFNTFQFKNFDLSFLFDWSYGFDILNANRAVFETPNTQRFNGLKGLADAWTPQNTDTDVNTIYYHNTFGVPPAGNQIDSRYIEDGSYLKFKSLSLGYTFPKTWTNKLGLQLLRLEVSGHNLYTFTNYSGYDPEVSVGKFGALTPHLDYSGYPQSRTFMMGLNVSL